MLEEKKIGELGHGIEKVVDLAKQINLEVDNGDVQELLDSQIRSRRWLAVKFMCRGGMKTKNSFLKLAFNNQS
ncbi:hypothetical protein TNCV_2362031 [Trichonephila clavipes]|nr:hypothetical protein TNCV_2362031 [Trichonephila clavipes]